ncbi:MAG: hypothetical protein RL499_1220 [Actinomycetota bacterium]|jgi:AcrR family transcriptional regulator
MCSALAPTIVDDQKTRARIRDVAITRFGADGFAGVSVRAIAAEAGVSPGLVMHHFGDKNGLREACDERVLAFVRAKISGVLTDSSQIIAELGAVGPYLARMVTEPSAAGDAIVDQLVAETQEMVEARVADGTMRAVGEPPLVALVITTHSLAPLLLRSHIERLAGDPERSDGGWAAIAAPLGQIYARGLFATTGFNDGMPS